MDQYGFALVGGFYVYVTVPYLYVAPIVELGSSSPNSSHCSRLEGQTNAKAPTTTT